MDPSGEGRAVPTIFNRRELFIAASMQEQAPYPRNIGPGRDRLPRIHTRTGGAVDRHGLRRMSPGRAVYDPFPERQVEGNPAGV